MSLTIRSFWASVLKKASAENSMNSQVTPTVMEKQKATMATKTGASWKFRTRVLSRSTRLKPTLAARNPFRVWSMVSQSRNWP